MQFFGLSTVASVLLAVTTPITAQSTGSFPSLTGTWVSKSKSVVTGPGFFDPVNEKFLEPDHTGISYSFTDDGWYEEAYFRAVSNPTKPDCPRAIMQWQHGKYTVNSTGSIILTPIESDGRQQTSDPCTYKYSSYVRYKQKETFLRYEVVTDGFHNVKRLNLYQFNGSPLMPLYLGYNPPQMLPTMTLLPTSTASATSGGSAAKSTSKAKVKRDSIEQRWVGQQMLKYGASTNPDWFWYAGLGFVSLGLGMYLYGN